MNVIECREEGIDPFKTRYWGGLGLCFLMANDLLHFEYKNLPSSEERILERLIQAIPMLEYSGHFSLSQKAARAFLMFTKFSPQPGESNHIDIDALLQENKSINSKIYWAVCVGILSHYLEADYEKLMNRETTLLFELDFFSNTLISPAPLNSILNELSADGFTLSIAFGDRNRGLLDMTPLRDKPIYKMDNAIYFSLDTRFLAEKLESGLFWLTHSCLETSSEKQKLHRYWGYAFENYVNWLLETGNLSGNNEFFPSPKFIESGEQVCDGIIRCGDSLVLMEYKGRTFTAKAKYSQDRECLSKELEKHLIGSDGYNKGIHQLAQSIKKILDRKNPQLIKGINITGIKKVFPLLITRDPLGSCFFINPYINKRATQFFFKKHFKPTKITPCFCVSIEDFEAMVAYLPFLKLTDLLNGWRKEDKTLRFSFLSLESKNSAISSIGFKRNDFLQKIFNEAWEEANKDLFSVNT